MQLQCLSLCLIPHPRSRYRVQLSSELTCDGLLNEAMVAARSALDALAAMPSNIRKTDLTSQALELYNALAEKLQVRGRQAYVRSVWLVPLACSQ